MPDAFVQAAFYLSPTVDEWWRWEDDAQVLAWHTGRTIAFTAEVTPVIGRLAPNGLPPFPLVAMLLAACHDDWETSQERKDVVRWSGRKLRIKDGVALLRNALAQNPDTRAADRTESDHAHANQIKKLIDGLDSVSQLPANLRRSVAAKSLLAEMLFEASPDRGLPDDAMRIADALAKGLSPDLLRPQLRASDGSSELGRAIGRMADCLPRLRADAIASRLRTGLDETVRPPEKELSPPEKVRQLLAALRNDEKLSGLAKLAHDLMAAVAVPRALRLREELQLGGVSDLTNRGPLDRLLVSELAQDDLTLAVRVAVNEAMYLRRESPPKEPPHHRAILIDVGVRMWGVPRVFATAVAMALSAMADPAAALNVFRAAGDNAVPVDLTTREGLMAHLSALETAAHPGEAMPAFVSAATAASAGDDGDTDCFVITHADAALDPDFLAAIARLGLPSLYVGAVDRDGTFDLSARTRAGQKPIRQAKLSLDEVLTGRPKSPPPVAVPIVDDSAGRDLPQIFAAKRFPFRLPYQVDLSKAAASDATGLVGVTDDGRLLHWTDQGRGAIELVHRVPRGQLRMLSVNDDRREICAFFSKGKETGGRLLVCGGDGNVRSFPIVLGHAPPLSAFQRGAFVFVISCHTVDAFDTRSGERVATVRMPDKVQHHRGRYFRVSGRIAVVAYDGSELLKFEMLPTPPATQPSMVFDRPGYEGYWFVVPGKVADQSLSNVFPLPTHLPPHNFADVSVDGRLLLFRSSGATQGKAYVVDLQDGGKTSEIHLQTWTWMRLGASGRYAESQPQIRRKFREISFNARRELVLSSGRVSRCLSFNGARLHLADVPPNTTFVGLQPFEQCHSKATRVKLHVARWPDGSRAWLDHRGLLHLRSSNRNLPELSIVLCDTQPPRVTSAAIWSSAGRINGPMYYIGDQKQTDISYFQEVLRTFVDRLRDGPAS